jgi:hypothetical protein
MIRKAFAIPDMPEPSVEKEIEKANKVKRKRASELEVGAEESHAD